MNKLFYKKGYKYQLSKDFKWLGTPLKPKQAIKTDFIELNTNGTLLIKKGYAWDGASGTTIDTKSSMRSALMHDAFYQLMRMKLLDRKNRKEVDDFFKAILIKDGMYRWRAYLWHKSVRKFAGFASDPKNIKKECSAP